MQTPRVLWIDLRTARNTPSAHARLRALCTTLMLTIGDPAAAFDATTIDRLVAFYEPAIVLFEFDRDDAAGRKQVAQAQERFPRLTVVMLTQQHASVDLGLPAALTDAAQDDGQSARAGRTRRTEPALRFVEQQLAERITLAAAAAACHLCKSEFSRAFKREHGTTFVDYVQRARAERAARLLAQGDVAVKEAAYAVGFNDLSYFGRVFRRHFGVSPSEYRLRADPGAGHWPTRRETTALPSHVATSA